VPVFDEIALLQPSAYATFAVTLSAADEGAFAALLPFVSARGGAVEDWSTGTRLLCRQCDAGAPRAEHDHPAAGGAARQFGIAATDGAVVRAALDQWRGAGPDREFAALERVL
jgi:hypothetical protein